MLDNMFDGLTAFQRLTWALAFFTPAVAVCIASKFSSGDPSGDWFLVFFGSAIVSLAISAFAKTHKVVLLGEKELKMLELYSMDAIDSKCHCFLHHRQNFASDSERLEEQQTISRLSLGSKYAALKTSFGIFGWIWATFAGILFISALHEYIKSANF